MYPDRKTAVDLHMPRAEQALSWSIRVSKCKVTPQIRSIRFRFIRKPITCHDPVLVQTIIFRCIYARMTP